MSLQLVHSRVDEMALVKMKGEFTAESLVEFHNIVEKLFENGESSVVFDMEEVSFIDSPAVGLVAHLLDIAGDAGKRLAFHKINPYVKKIMTLAISPGAIQEIEFENHS